MSLQEFPVYRERRGNLSQAKIATTARIASLRSL
jgi:hypothetical protein